MRVIVNHPTLGAVTVGVVEGLSIETIKEGGIEFFYDSEIGAHAKGTRHATFTIRRWFMTDLRSGAPLGSSPYDKDLLWDIFNDDVVFNLVADLPQDYPSGIARLTLSACQIYRWRPVTGTANDIIAEEAVGEALDWCGADYTVGRTPSD